MCHSTGVEVRGQCVEVSSQVPLCVSQVLNSSHEAQQQVHLSTESFCWPSFFNDLKNYYCMYA